MHPSLPTLFFVEAELNFKCHSEFWGVTAKSVLKSEFFLSKLNLTIIIFAINCFFSIIQTFCCSARWHLLCIFCSPIPWHLLVYFEFALMLYQSNEFSWIFQSVFRKSRRQRNNAIDSKHSKYLIVIKDLIPLIEWTCYFKQSMAVSKTD